MKEIDTIKDIEQIFLWKQVKRKGHDASGITEPEKWLWYKSSNGIYYPFMRFKD